jgi:2,3-bisphosphoglycerate-independent phosphoglycerate mutase
MSSSHGAPRRPVVLIILDGFGANPAKINNAVAEAHTPHFDHYFSTQPHTTILASGRAVGLPDGQMGNSEVGHTILGCGAIVRQDLVIIDDAIADGSFYKNSALLAAASLAASRGRPLHLIGLVSDGGVHSHMRHLLALIELCKQRQVIPLLHMITDGRDTAPNASLSYLKDLERALLKAGGDIASITGRYYAMDRDNRWDRTERAWRALTRGEGLHATSAREAIEQAWARGESDEFIQPTLLPGAWSLAGDESAVFFNFRKDRPRQLLSALFKREFSEFDRGDYAPIHVTCMMEYDRWYGLPVAFDHEKPTTTLAQVISEAGIKQFHCAETEKAAHVTYFFNGGRSEPYSGEIRIVVDSPRVTTYDLAPEMSAQRVADETIAAIDSGEYGFIVVNFANGDMVGHTAVREAVLRAVETLDREASRVIDAAMIHGYSVIMTADHGNCDELIDPANGKPHTQHSIYPVPLMVIDSIKWRLSTGGGLANVAPTVLHLMGLPLPAAFSARSLLLQPAI